MGRLEYHRRSDIALERVFPSGHANAPFVAGLESGKTPFRARRYQIVSIEHREVEKLASDQYTDSVQSGVFRSGAAIAIAEKTG